MLRMLSILALLLIQVGGAVAEDTLVFTAIPDQDETRLVQRFTRVAEYLQAKLGVPVKYLPVKSYPATVAAFSANQVQLAWFGSRKVLRGGAWATRARMITNRYRNFFTPDRRDILAGFRTAAL